MSELLAGDAYAISLLSADFLLMELLTGGFHNEKAPAGCVFPYLLMVENSASDRNSVGGYRLTTRSNKLFKIVDQRDDFDGIGPIAQRVDNVLQQAHGRQVAIEDSGITTTVILGIIRVSPFKNAYTSESREYRELGGIYRVYVKSN